MTERESTGLASMMQQDREDLMAVLEMRFGFVPHDVRNRIMSVDELDELQRLILVAANAPTWDEFEKELYQHGTFRISADPLANRQNASDSTQSERVQPATAGDGPRPAVEKGEKA